MSPETGVVLGYLVPHPPNLLEAEEKGEELETVDALRRAGDELRAGDVDLIFVATTHWQPVGPFFIDASPRHRHATDYFGFSVEISYECPGDPELAKAVMDAAGGAGVMADCIWSRGIDHGVSIPLHFMVPAADIAVLPLSVSTRPMEECRRWGEVIHEACTKAGRRAAFIASGAISHKLPLFAQPHAPSRFQRFEELMIEALSSASPEMLMEIDDILVEEAEPEGGLRDLLMLLGAMGEQSRGELISYESFYGLGFAAFKFTRG